MIHPPMVEIIARATTAILETASPDVASPGALAMDAITITIVIIMNMAGSCQGEIGCDGITDVG